MGPALGGVMPQFVRFHGRSRVLAGSPRRRLCIGARSLGGRDEGNVNNIDTFSDGHLPKAISVAELITKWNMIKAQTAGERPHSRAK